MIKLDLFDRIIDIELLETSGRSFKIDCPRSGIKPEISISGELRANTVQNATLKITNFYTPRPLNVDSLAGAVYRWVIVKAGYAKNALTTIEGQNFLAYTESPGPDGVSVITFITGAFDEWVQTVINSNWTAGTSINSVMATVCSKLSEKTAPYKIELKSYIPDSIAVSTGGLSASGSLTEFIDKVKVAYGLAIYMEGRNLSVCYADSGTGVVHKLDYVTSVRKNGAGYTIIAPWLPSLRQNDTLEIDAKYFAIENFGGVGANFKTQFKVLNISFAFSTVGDTNSMTVTCIGAR